MRKYIFCLLLICFSASAWYPVEGYHNERLFGIKGVLTENAGLKKANAELVWYPYKRMFGVTFYSLIDHSDEVAFTNGKFMISGCNRMISGDILGPQLIINKYEVTKLARIFRVCNDEIELKVVDNQGHYGTYRIDGHNKMDFKELKAK
ncbi:hypothetical protein BI036_gp094 [Morganella phage vB_MmoM_MP1]|uniref:Uncharacterized protein n=1 Tax=Morganella phage vB_MmoM_MP1 TaxID=1852628 RepID=A0A192YAE4_9CAUD|nr:hypothetical protein BI036_gp094 [Morganella phage vB_MmoM_MP1]ANM46512.1 hypothetical protein MP1_gp0093 [Morganella phage vB_MmoM_MP1]